MVKKTAAGAVGDDDSLSDADRRALRGSRFAPLPPPSRSHPRPSRLAHPGGPVATNKAAALAKFLERKLQGPGGLGAINPDHLERAVVNAKETLRASNNGGASTSRTVRHVTSFGDSSEEIGQNAEDSEEISEESMRNHKKRQMKKTEVVGIFRFVVTFSTFGLFVFDSMPTYRRLTTKVQRKRKR